MNNMNEVLEKVTDLLKNQVKTETLIGQPFQLGEYTCVPVISVGVGFGGGAGRTLSKQGEQADAPIGVGAGIGMKTTGFLVSRGDSISFVPTTVSRGLDSVIEKIPDVLQKFIDRPKDDGTDKKI